MPDLSPNESSALVDVDWLVAHLSDENLVLLDASVPPVVPGFVSSDSSPKCETVFSVTFHSAIFRRIRLKHVRDSISHESVTSDSVSHGSTISECV